MIKKINQILRVFNIEVRRRYSDQFEVKRNLLNKRKNPVIIDVGAHHGGCIEAYQKMFASPEIFAFEPTSGLFSVLHNRFATDSKVKLYNIALSNVVGEFDFHINHDSFANSLLEVDQRSKDSWGSDMLLTYETQKVKVTTLDTFYSEAIFENIDILKIDVQGAEMNVLQGAEKLLKDKRISLIYCEIILAPTYQGQGNYVDILSYLNSHNFLLYGIYDLWKKNDRLLQFDALFAHESILTNH